MDRSRSDFVVRQFLEECAEVVGGKFADLGFADTVADVLFKIVTVILNRFRPVLWVGLEPTVYINAKRSLFGVDRSRGGGPQFSNLLVKLRVRFGVDGLSDLNPF